MCNNVIITGCVLLGEKSFNKEPLLLLLLNIYFIFIVFLNIIYNYVLC